MKQKKSAATLEDVPKAPAASWITSGSALLVVVLAFRVHGLFGITEYLNHWLVGPSEVIPHPQVLLRHAWHILLASALMIAVAGTGRLMLRRMVRPLDLWEDAFLSFALGYGVWGTALFLLGMAGAWHAKILVGLFVAALLLGTLSLAASARRRGLSVGGSAPLPSLPARLACVFAGLAWLCLVRYALIPETFYDALQYHLALPNLYLLHGKILPTPENSYSGTPALPQMLYGWALALDSWGVVAGLLHAATAAWTAVGMIALSRRLGRPGAGFLAAAMFYLTPVVMGESFRVSVGLEWTLLQLACLISFLAAFSERPGTPERNGWGLLCASFLGWTMATKYPAWFLPAAFIPAVMFARCDECAQGEQPLHRPVGRELLWAGFIAATWLSPWVVKNIWFYGNPVYPFFHESIAPVAAHMPDWRQMSAAVTDLRTARGLRGYFIHPWNFVTPVEDITESVGPLYLGLLPLLLIAGLSNTQRLVAWLCLGTWLPLSLTSSITRYFIPHLAPLAVLLACALEQLPTRRAREIMAGLASLAACSIAFAYLVLDANHPKLSTYLGAKSFSEYLSHTVVSYPTPAYAGIQYINENTAQDAKVLLFGEARAFYLRRKYLAASSDQRSVLEAWAESSGDEKDLRLRFSREGVDYILVNLGELSRRRLAPQVSPRGFAVLDAFWSRYTLRLFGVQDAGDRWVGVYRVLDDAEASKPHPVDPLFAPYRGRYR